MKNVIERRFDKQCHKFLREQHIRRDDDTSDVTACANGRTAENKAIKRSEKADGYMVERRIKNA